MSQIYNDKTKRPQPKENQLGILGISSREFMHFAGKSAKSLGSRSAAKSCYIFPLKVATTFLSGSGKGAVKA